MGGFGSSACSKKTKQAGNFFFDRPSKSSQPENAIDEPSGPPSFHETGLADLFHDRPLQVQQRRATRTSALALASNKKRVEPPAVIDAL